MTTHGLRWDGGERRRFVQLLALTLGHFTVDFYGGFLAPIWNPTLRLHLGGALLWMVILVGLFGLIVNVVQPIAGLLLPRRGLPALLVAPPAVTALMACLGLSHQAWVAVGILIVVALGLALFHPEGMLASHAISGRHESLGVPMFISGGFFGMSCGNLLAAWWAEHYGLAGFWLLAWPGVAVTGLMLACGLHRLEGHADDNERATRWHGIPFRWVVCVGVLVAASATFFVLILTSVMQARFPDDRPQQWAGLALFAFGLTGALCSYGWGYLSDRVTRMRALAVSQALSLAPLYWLMTAESPRAVVGWSVACGAGMGGTFPLVVMLARNARGLSQRLRAALIMGGSWGAAALLFMLAGAVWRHAPAVVLGLCLPLLAATAALAWILGKAERA